MRHSTPPVPPIASKKLWQAKKREATWRVRRGQIPNVVS